MKWYYGILAILSLVLFMISFMATLGLYNGMGLSTINFITAGLSLYFYLVFDALMELTFREFDNHR